MQIRPALQRVHVFARDNTTKRDQNMDNSCIGGGKYRDALGKPGVGVHTHLFGVAVFDLLLTVGGAWWVSARYDVSFFVTLLILLIIGIIAHEAFCVDTALNRALFRPKQARTD